MQNWDSERKDTSDATGFGPLAAGEQEVMVNICNAAQDILAAATELLSTSIMATIEDPAHAGSMAMIFLFMAVQVSFGRDADPHTAQHLWRTLTANRIEHLSVPRPSAICESSLHRCIEGKHRSISIYSSKTHQWT